MGDLQIIPTIMVETVAEMQRKLELVKDKVKRVQIDIVEEIFADNKTITVAALERVNTGLIMDVQLMVQNPVIYVNQCDQVGVERIYGHVEQMPDQGEFVDKATDLGIQVGLGLDIHTPIVSIEKMLPFLDAVLLMAVEVGFSRQVFDEKVLKKIDELRAHQFDGDICIDGGLDKEEIKLCREHGANHFAVNSALWKSKDISDKLEELRGAL